MEHWILNHCICYWGNYDAVIHDHRCRKYGSNDYGLNLKKEYGSNDYELNLKKEYGSNDYELNLKKE
ncbi:MAG: hypothetical protein MJ235_07540 [archaeon]|nr:hypothetical protein [archaeon]